MNESVVLGLIRNIAILLTFSMLYDYFWSRNENHKSYFIKIGSGIILGGIGIVLILTPWHFVPGVFFDTRSVMLSIAALFFGPVPSITAMIITGIYRIYMGGAGTLMGTAVVFTSGTIGLLWWYFRPEWRRKNYLLELAALGLTVHLVMLALTFLLPDEVRWKTIESIALPVILIYPLATVLLGILMLNQAENWENRKALNISEERWNFALEGPGDGVWDWNPQTNEIFYSKQWKLMLGYAEHEIGKNLEEWEKRVFPEDLEPTMKLLNQHINGETTVYISEHRLLCKDGTYKWILDRGKIMAWDANGKPIRFIGTHTDISERKDAQQKINKLNEELEQKVQERTLELSLKNADLEKMNKFFVGRELRMIELKEQIKVLEEKLKSLNNLKTN